MGLFRKKMQDTVQDAVGMVKDITTKATAEKMDIWGDAAKIGIFAIMAAGAVKGLSKGGKKHDGDKDHPDVRTMTINNYYYGYRPNQQGRKKNDRVS